MLSQQLRRVIARSNVINTSRLSLTRVTYAAGPSRLPARAFSASARRHDEMPRSPFQTFVDTLKEELRKNRDVQDNYKQLQGDVAHFQDSEAMKRARDAYERARVCLWIIMV
jgi:import inner membrane translocase subunit TIM44